MAFSDYRTVTRQKKVAEKRAALLLQGQRDRTPLPSHYFSPNAWLLGGACLPTGGWVPVITLNKAHALLMWESEIWSGK